MGLTETEQARQKLQRRDADFQRNAEVILLKKMGLVLAGLASGVAILSGVATATWWFSTRAARDEVAPVRDLARDNAASIVFMKEDLSDIKKAVTAQTEMLRKALDRK